jgi:hypothetical protein
MPKYYFDVADGINILDKRGVVLRDRLEAVGYAQTLLAAVNERTPPTDARPWCIVVSDEQREHLFEVPSAEDMSS